jgi:hypothetical protein
MYETKYMLCPVRSSSLYMSKIHKNIPEFLQRPKISFDKESIWYKQSPVGKTH